MISAATIVELLYRRALSHPDLPAYTFISNHGTSESYLTYASLEQEARCIGAALQEYGLPDDRVLLLYPPGLEFISAFLGCLCAGFIAVPAYPPRFSQLERSFPRLRAIIRDAQPKIVLTTAALLPRLEAIFNSDEDLRAISLLTTDTMVLDQSMALRDISSRSNAIAFLQYTSGSTALPKGVMVSNANLLHNLACIYDNFGHSSESRGVIWLPPYHDMGLIGGILQPLYGGFPVFLMAPATFLQRPLNWLQAISHYRATTSGGPNFAYDLCVRKVTPEEIGDLDLSCWEVAFNGAEPIQAAVLERFTSAFASCGFRREAFYPCYGLAEATLIVSAGGKALPYTQSTFQGDALAQGHVIEERLSIAQVGTLVGCGKSISDQRIVIVDPQTRCACTPGQIGEIWVSGPSIAQGYWNCPEETASTFQARLAQSDEGPFLRTGDLGFFYKEDLFISGRIKDLIIIRGLNHYPQDIEATTEQSHPSLYPGGSAAFTVQINGEQCLVIAAEVERHFRTTEVAAASGAIRQAVSAEHGLYIQEIMLLKRGTIPKTTSGKIQRHACRAGYLDGSLASVGRSSLGSQSSQESAIRLERETLLASPPEKRQQLLEEYVCGIIAQALQHSPAAIQLQQPISRLGLDSLMAAQLQRSIEADLGVELSTVFLLEGYSIREIATRLLTHMAAGYVQSSALPTPSRQERDDSPIVLSFAQERLWFLSQLMPNSPVYTIPIALHLAGLLSIHALEQSFNTIIQRHEILRTIITTTQGYPRQMIVPTSPFQIITVDLQALPWEQRTAEALRLCRSAALRPFDLTDSPLLRVMLVRLKQDEHILFMAIHHIVSDDWSMRVLIQEINSLYTAFLHGSPVSLPELPLQYADYAKWQRQWLQGEVLEEQIAYWREKLAEAPPVLSLLTDRPRPPIQSFRGATHRFTLPIHTFEAIKELSRQTGATIFMIVLAAFQTLLMRYTGQVDILVGTPVAGRIHKNLDTLIGCLMNTVVLRTNLSGDPSFLDLLDRVRTVCLEAYKHQHIPFEPLVEKLHPLRDLSINPLVQILIGFQNVSAADVNLPGLDAHSLPIDTQTSKFDLTLTLEETAQGLGGTFEYATDLFDAATIERMAGHYQRLLAGIVQDASQPIEALPLLTAAERQLLLEQGTATATPFPQTLAVHQLFEARAAAQPDAVALLYEQQVLTYAALNRRANQLGHALRRLGVGPDTLVALCVERSPELLIGMLGILKAGAAYLPLDPSYPHERLAFMLQDAQVPVLLTQQRLVAQLPTAGLHLLCLDTDWATVAQEPASQPPVSVTPDQLLYVLYTSGSTGTPKGVMITHRNVVNFLQAMRRQPGMTEQDILLAITSFSFDIAALELFLPLVTGARLVLAEQSALADGAQLAAYLTTFAITIMQATPATWQLLVTSGWQGHAALKILTGGEAISRTLADQLLARAAEVWNMYGPTETTIWSSCARIEAASAAISLGHPIDNTDFYVLDPHQQPVPIGVPGQLYIGGAGLARGYLYRPELTAEQFVPHPWSRQPGERLYQTGDRVQMRADGSLRFLGRLDNQVKLRGFRIELREIEIAIDAHPSIRAGVVVARADGAGGQRLVAYLVAEPGPVPTVAELRTFLMHRLPDYMLPASFVMLDALPLTPNGKVQYRALPAPLDQRPATETVYLPPTNEVEHTIATIWQELLHIEKVGIHDNFFDLGGHSLLVTQIVIKLKEIFGYDMSVIDIFQYPTISTLSQHLTSEQNKNAARSQETNRADARRKSLANLGRFREEQRNIRK